MKNFFALGRPGAFNGISHNKLFAIFFSKPMVFFFYQIILSHTQGTTPNKSMVKKSNVINDKAFSRD